MPATICRHVCYFLRTKDFSRLVTGRLNVAGERIPNALEGIVNVSCQRLQSNHSRKCNQGDHEDIFDEILSLVPQKQILEAQNRSQYLFSPRINLCGSQQRATC
jgi:hypothetical protein